jgi:hypothetical protein
VKKRRVGGGSKISFNAMHADVFFPIKELRYSQGKNLLKEI